MESLAFYISAAVMLFFGAMVVLNRNPVSSALSLVMSFVGLAALFISLDAYFIGTIQILVYAGAVMVLFLFIIMLLDLKAEVRRKFNVSAVVGGGLVGLVLVLSLGKVLASFEPGQAVKPEVAAIAEHTYEDVRSVGALAWQNYAFHLQIIGLLLVAATLGVVALSKKEPASK